jgi:hypothetical protein
MNILWMNTGQRIVFAGWRPKNLTQHCRGSVFTMSARQMRRRAGRAQRLRSRNANFGATQTAIAV